MHNKKKVKYSTSTNVIPTYIEWYNDRTVKTLDLQMSDWFKPCTETNGRLRQTLNQHKFWTGLF